MLRVVLDTNVLISGLVWRGLPGQAVQAASQSRCLLLLTDSLLQELRVTLVRPKFTQRIEASGNTVSDLIAEVVQASLFVEPTLVPDNAVRDPKDRQVLACAVGGQADCIVTGDADLLTLVSYEAIPIWTVTYFLRQLSTE
jgi:hypothetical protein